MYLVTGGAGFIGSHIVRQLVADGHRVRVFDDFSTGRHENLEQVAGQIELVSGDLRDAEAVVGAVAGAQVVFHLGAVTSVPRSVADPRTTMNVGVAGTLNVLLAARDHGVERVVFSSSSAVYGGGDESPKHEGMAPQPMSPYAISKLTGEQLCAIFTTLYGLETVALRYFNVYGSGQDPKSDYAAVIPKFVAALRAGKRPTIYGDGQQTRDFVHVSDVVAANLHAATIGQIAGQVFNIGTGRAVDINRLLELTADALGIRVQALHSAGQPGDVRHSLGDITSAREVLGFHPLMLIEEGIRRTIMAE